MEPEPVYYARLYAAQGYLAVIDRAWTFYDVSTEAVIAVSLADCNWLTTQGPVTEAATTRLLRQRMRGQHSHLACRMGE